MQQLAALTQSQQNPAAAVPASSADSNLVALLAQISQPNYSAPQQPQQPPASSVAPYENPERKRMRETTDEYDGRDDGYNKRPNTNSYQGDHESYNGRPNTNDYEGRNEGYNNRNNTDRTTIVAAKKWDRPKPKYSDDNNPNKFLLPCRFWPKGECRKGTKCTYRHDPLT
jgi:hypothetical protein